MIEMIKEIGIFIVIAQAVLYFVPSENYVKYVKVIVGILMIVKIAGPILSFEAEEVLAEIMESGNTFAQEMEEASGLSVRQLEEESGHFALQDAG